MTYQLAHLASPKSQLPVLIAVADEHAQTRFWEFFAANIRNMATRRADAQATREFLGWCESAGVPSIVAVQPLHVAIYIDEIAHSGFSRLRGLIDSWCKGGRVGAPDDPLAP